MDHTYVDEKSLKSLEDLAVFLTSSLLSLRTLHNTQVQSIECGIMKEDMNERANTIAWDLRRLIKLYKIQLEAVLELLPDEFNAEATILRLKQYELKKARKMTKIKKVKEDANVQ